MTAPTAREVAEGIVAAWYPAISPKLYRDKLTAAITEALQAREAAVWRAAAELVRAGTVVLQSEPPIPVTHVEVDALREQIAAALAARGEAEK